MRQYSFFFLLLFAFTQAQSQPDFRWVEVGDAEYDLPASTPYHIRLFLPYGAKDLDDLNEFLYPMRFELTWVEETVSPDSVKLLFQRQIENHFKDKEGLKLYKHFIKFFLRKLHATKKGDVWAFEYFPDEGIRLFIEDKEVHLIIGVEMNRALLRSWMEYSPILKSKLISKLLKIQQ